MKKWGIFEFWPKGTDFSPKVVLLSLALPLAVVLVHLIWRWRKWVSMVNQLPMMKLRFYHILGHAQAVIYLRTLKTSLPHHVYDFIVLNGYSWLYRRSSLVAVWAWYFPVVHVHRADSAETILNHSTELQKGFSYKFTEPWLGNGLLTSHGSKWRQRRKLLTPAFHFNILKDFVVVFNKQSRIFTEALDSRAGHEYVDVVPFVTKCSFDIMCETMLGVEAHAQKNLFNPYLDSVSFLTGALFERMLNPLLWPDFIFRISPLGRKFTEHTQLVHQFTYKMIAEKKRQKLASSPPSGDDQSSRKKRALLDLMLDEHLVGNSTLSESDIREEIDTFTFEGHDTTAMAMSWALYLVGLHPGVQEKIHQELDSLFEDSDRDVTMDDLREMKYLECVLKETLRLFPPVPYFGRQIQNDLEFQGMVVPKGTTCMIFPYFLHRNPEAFPNPEKFDPERFTPENSAGRNPFSYIPFSAGPRNCIGQRFALLEEKVVLATVLRRFRLRSLDPRDKIQIMNEIVLRPLDGLRIEIRPRNYKPEKPPTFFYCQ